MADSLCGPAGPLAFCCRLRADDLKRHRGSALVLVACSPCDLPPAWAPNPLCLCASSADGGPHKFYVCPSACRSAVQALKRVVLFQLPRRQRMREIFVCYCVLLNSSKPLTGKSERRFGLPLAPALKTGAADNVHFRRGMPAAF